MDIIQWIADTVNAILKHGWSVTTFIVALTALLRVNAVRRALLKRLPKRFRHEDKLDSIQRDIRAIKAHLGVEGWDADYLNGKNEQNEMSGVPKKLLSPQAVSVPVTTIKHFTPLKGIFHSLQRRMNMNILKSKWLSRKFLTAYATIIVVVLNDILDLGVNAETIYTVAGIVATWIAGESAVDIARAKSKKMDEPGDTGPAV